MRWTLAISISLIFLLSIASAGNVYAQGAAASYRYCTASDLTGTWKMVQFSELPRRKEAQWVIVAPYHYITFYPENAYSFLAAMREATSPQGLQSDLLWAQRAGKQLAYTLGSKGELNLYMDKNPLYSYRCFVLTASSGVYMKNDLILAGFALKDPRSKIFKLYRRWF